MINIQLIQNSQITKEESEAALRGIKRFEKFGVQCESNTKISRVMMGRKITKIISQESTISNMDFKPTVLDFLLDRKSIGLGLGPYPLLLEIDNSKTESCIGVAKTGVGAVVSIFGIRNAQNFFYKGISIDKKTAIEAIEIATAHEIGHVLGITEHCKNCIMKENSCFRDFIENLRSDLCKECFSKISRFCNSLIY